MAECVFLILREIFLEGSKGSFLVFSMYTDYEFKYKNNANILCQDRGKITMKSFLLLLFELQFLFCEEQNTKTFPGSWKPGIVDLGFSH